MPAGQVISNGQVHVWEKRTVPRHRYATSGLTFSVRGGLDVGGGQREVDAAAEPPSELCINFLRELEKGPIQETRGAGNKKPQPTESRGIPC